MNRTISLSTLLLLISLGVAAEGGPVPVPTPGDMAQEARDPIGAQATTRRTGVRVAQVAGRAPTWDGRLRLGAGWDSNALLESDPDTAQSSTADYATEAGLGWRPVADERNFVKATGLIAYNHRPHLEDLDTSKLALGVSGAHQGEVVTTGGSLSAARYWLDGDGAAAELRGGGSLAWLRKDSADLLALEIALIHFNESADMPEGAKGLFELGDADDRSGTLAAGAWRHWWQLGGGNRIEVAARAGHYFANSESENYSLVQPWLALRLRPERWEVLAKAAIEGRSYDSERVVGDGSEQAVLATLTGSADRRLGYGLWAGAYAGLSTRSSNYD